MNPDVEHSGKTNGVVRVGGLGLSHVEFFLPRLMPGDPAATLFARLQGTEPEAMDSLREAFGFTEGPLLEQYWVYLTHLFQGELGVSVAYFPRDGFGSHRDRAGLDSGPTGVAVLLGFGLGTLLGVIAAWRREGALDTFAPPRSRFSAHSPILAGHGSPFVFGFQLDWFPIRHAYGMI